MAGHEPGEDERLRLRAALREPALHEQDVEPLLHPGKRSPGACYKCVMELRGDRVVLRPLAEGDVARIVELGADPEVGRAGGPGSTPEHVGEKARGEDEGVVVLRDPATGARSRD